MSPGNIENIDEANSRNLKRFEWIFTVVIWTRDAGKVQYEVNWPLWIEGFDDVVFDECKIS